MAQNGEEASLDGQKRGSKAADLVLAVCDSSSILVQDLLHDFCDKSPFMFKDVGFSFCHLPPNHKLNTLKWPFPGAQ